MAAGQKGVSSPQKNSVRGKRRALHRKGSIRKLTGLSLNLPVEQYKILEKLVVVMEYKSVEEYVNAALLSIMQADADHSLAGVPREEALKILEKECS